MLGSEQRLAIGIDVGGTNIKAGIVRFDRDSAVIVEHAHHPTGVLRSIEEFVQFVTELIQTWCDRYPSVEAVGIGFPACIDWQTGLIFNPPNISWWNSQQFALSSELFHRLQRPVVVDNDANAAALAEYWLGVGRQWRTFLFVTLGTGVGGAFILDGRLYRGDYGCAGEIGHLIINAQAPLDTVPYRTGVLECYVGRDAIIERARRIAADFPDSSLAVQHDNLDVEAIGHAALHGERAAIAVIEETAELLGIGLASAVAVLGVAHIVVAGGIAGLPDRFFHAVERTLRQRALPALAEKIEVVRSTLGNTAGVLGAALLAIPPAR